MTKTLTETHQTSLPVAFNSPKGKKIQTDGCHTNVVAISESDWQQTIIDLLHLHGYRVCEFRKARIQKNGEDVYRTSWGADGVGFPDLIGIHTAKKSLIVIENKSMKGTVSPEQWIWLEAWASISEHVFILKPDDYEQFKEVLERI